MKGDKHKTGEFGVVNISACVRRIRRLHFNLRKMREDNGDWCRKLDNESENGAGDEVHALLCREIEKDKNWAYRVKYVLDRYATSDMLDSAEKAFQPRASATEPDAGLFT